jgi:hypothetical protein
MLAFLDIICRRHSPLSEAHLALVHTALQKPVLPSSSSKTNKTCSLEFISLSHVCILHIPHTADSPHCIRILGFSQRCEWYISSSGKRRCVTVYVVPDVAIQSSGLFFKSRKVHEEKGLKVLKPRLLKMRRQGRLETLGTKQRLSVKSQNKIRLNLSGNNTKTFTVTENKFHFYIPCLLRELLHLILLALFLQ